MKFWSMVGSMQGWTVVRRARGSFSVSHQLFKYFNGLMPLFVVEKPDTSRLLWCQPQWCWLTWLYSPKRSTGEAVEESLSCCPCSNLSSRESPLLLQNLALIPQCKHLRLSVLFGLETSMPGLSDEAWTTECFKHEVDKFLHCACGWGCWYDMRS